MLIYLSQKVVPVLFRISHTQNTYLFRFATVLYHLNVTIVGMEVYILV